MVSRLVTRGFTRKLRPIPVNPDPESYGEESSRSTAASCVRLAPGGSATGPIPCRPCFNRRTLCSAILRPDPAPARRLVHNTRITIVDEQHGQRAARLGRLARPCPRQTRRSRNSWAIPPPRHQHARSPPPVSDEESRARRPMPRGLPWALDPVGAGRHCVSHQKPREAGAGSSRPASAGKCQRNFIVLAGATADGPKRDSCARLGRPPRRHPPARQTPRGRGWLGRAETAGAGPTHCAAVRP